MTYTANRGASLLDMTEERLEQKNHRRLNSYNITCLFISNDGPAHEYADSAGYRRAGFTPSLAARLGRHVRHRLAHSYRRPTPDCLRRCRREPGRRRGPRHSYVAPVPGPGNARPAASYACTSA